MSSRSKGFRFALIILVVAIFANGHAAGGKKKGNKWLNNLCDAGKVFLTSYSSNCGGSGSQTAGTGTGSQKAVDSSVVALCAVMLCPQNQNCTRASTQAKRFHSADDITESEQKTRIAMTRSLNAPDSSDICSGPYDSHIQEVMKRLDRVLDHYQSLKTIKTNFPLLASRTIQAQIALAQEKLTLVPNRAELLNKLRSMKDWSSRISMLLERDNSEKWNWVDRMVSSTFFWKMPVPNVWKNPEILSKRETEPVSEFQNLNEYRTSHEKNNECYLQMIKDCSLTQECADLLMDKSAILTTLGHNIRFFQLATMLNCVREVDFVDKFTARGTNWESELEGQCSLMWNEANVIANADFPTGYKGLFLLHGASCAFMGFPNFLRVDWILRIMSWMDATKNGCIAPDTKTGQGDGTSFEYDDVADDGEWCSVWETSLATQILITHLRYILETCNAPV